MIRRKYMQGGIVWIFKAFQERKTKKSSLKNKGHMIN